MFFPGDDRHQFSAMPARTWLIICLGLQFPGLLHSWYIIANFREPDAQAVATEVWREVFASGPYTCFKMVEAVAILLGMTPTDILTSPARLKSFGSDSVTENNISQPPL